MQHIDQEKQIQEQEGRGTGYKSRSGKFQAIEGSDMGYDR